jgi:hypothetical protein
VGTFLDAPVAGVEYSSSANSGIKTTDANGHFFYHDGEQITFKIGQVILGEVVPSDSNGTVTPLEVVGTNDTNNSRVVEILRILQTIDSNQYVNDGIQISKSTREALNSPDKKINLSTPHTPLSDAQLQNITNETNVVSVQEAENHFQTQLEQNTQQSNSSQTNNDQTDSGTGTLATNSDNANNDSSVTSDNSNTQESSDDSDSENGDNNSGTNNNTTGSNDTNGGNTTTNTGNNTSGGGSTTNPTNNSGYTLLAWNDLGMHCMDGKDFSVFSILPPYNNLDAQLILKQGTSNKHITTGVTLTYESLDHAGHVNTTSIGKTNFFSYKNLLFPGAGNTQNIGLTGNKAPSHTPSAMTYNATNNWFEATGIPLFNYDDNGIKNFYPMVRVVAKDTSGATLATADVVLPVSDEMDCSKCHSSTVTSQDARPSMGWVNNSNTLQDYKFNILRIHDDKNPYAVRDYQSELTAAGYDYNVSGLEATANAGKPILCSICHKSNALATSGFAGIKSLTQALHSKHASVKDPLNGLSLNNSTNRNACYSCHPGATTQCLRGAMGNAKDANGNNIMQCQSCHGNMSNVGSSNRQGWFSEPNCQACHQSGHRYTSALSNGTLRTSIDRTFATNLNTPISGVSLYRYSKGHGNLQCSSCHGSTHAIFPTSHVQDNILSTQIQGHTGTIAECTACHATMPATTNKGPHGMHSTGQGWVSDHKHVAENNSAQCKVCHGDNYRGSVLSKTFSARTLQIEHGVKSFAKGHQVSCFDCHNGPNP